MSGRKGQLHRAARNNTGRRRIWQSMRILRSFTLPDLARTADVKIDNAKKFTAALTIHGYLRVVAENTGMNGGYKRWVLICNQGPDHPLVCSRCGKSIMAAKKCEREVGHDGK